MNVRENMLLAYHHKLPESIPNFFTDYNIWRSLGERNYGDGDGKDWFGIQWIQTPELRSQTIMPGQKELESLENWKEHITIPNLNDYNWAKIAEDATKDWDRENKVSMVLLLMGPLERLISIMGFENAVCAFYDTPDEVHEFFRELTEYKCQYIKILKDYFQVDVIQYHDDWGHNENMFFAMDIWLEFFEPYIRRVCEYTHEVGMIFEMHSCGYIMPTMPYLIEMGVDAFDPIQFSNDIKKMKKLYGDKILLNGGFDSQGVLERPGASEEEIRKHVRDVIDIMAPGGNYITMCPIINPSVVNLVSNEIQKYGKDFYVK